MLENVRDLFAQEPIVAKDGLAFALKMLGAMGLVTIADAELAGVVAGLYAVASMALALNERGDVTPAFRPPKKR